MKYRVELDVSFELENDAISLLNLVEESIKPKTFKPSGSEQILVIRKCRYHKCFHDDPIPLPCGNYVNVDFDGVLIEYQNDLGVKITKDTILEDRVIDKG